MGKFFTLGHSVGLIGKYETSPKVLSTINTLAYLGPQLIDKMFYNNSTLKLYGHIQFHIVMSKYVGHCQSLLTQPNICGQGRIPTIRAGVHSGRLQICLQKYYLSLEVIDSDKHSSLLRYKVNLKCRLQGPVINTILHIQIFI